MKIERIATAVLFTMVSGARAAPRERVLPVIEIHASAHRQVVYQVAKTDDRAPEVIADSVYASVMSRLDAAKASRMVNTRRVPVSQASYAVDLLWVESGK